MNRIEASALRSLLLRNTTMFRVTIGQLQRGTLSVPAAVAKLSTLTDALDNAIACIEPEE